jgi:thiol-disulfide isomerase/thioredoxin
MKHISLLALALTLSLSALAKPGYKFTLQIDGNTDTMMVLGYYYAQHIMVFDTAYNNGHGRFIFQGNHETPPGLYYFSNAKGRFVDFVLYHEKPQFKFHTDDRDWTRNMTVSGSPQNTVFFNFHRATSVVYDEVDAAQHTMDSAAFAHYRRQRYLSIDTIRMKTIQDHPQAMLSRMMQATMDPPSPPDGLSQNDRYFWAMHHYFDHFPLNDDFIIRTPKAVFYQRVTDYVDKYMQGLPPDKICPLLDTLIDRAEPAPEVYRWLIQNITEKYLQSNVMVYDEVYVHLVQRYFATGKASWYSPSTIDEQVERATKWERILVGRVAPELILFDTLRRPVSLHHMPGDYTLLLFWSPTCGHCRDIIPAVYNVFDRYADSLNITAFAILTEPDETTVEKWKKFISNHNITNRRWVNLNGGEANVDWREVYDITTTPQIFLIENKEHKFIAKKLNADLLEQIFKQLK